MAKKKQLSLEELLEQALVKDEDQPYEVPKNWVWTRFEFLVDRLQYGYTESANYDKVGPRFLRITDIQDNNINWVNVPYCKITDKDYDKYKVNDGDIVVARTGATTGKSYLVSNPPDAVFASYLIRISLISKVIPQYMWLFMNSPYYWKQITENKKGSAQPGVNAQKLGQIVIPMPSSKEQQRIVALIEALFEKLDRAKKIVQSALESFENRKSAILHKAFTGELTRNWREENGVDFENDWVKRQLKDVCKLTSGGTPSRKIMEYYTGNIPWIKTGEINWSYIFDSEEKITREAIENSSAKLFPVGTVLVAMYGQGLTRGRAAILATEAATNQAVCGLITHSVLKNSFLYYYFMHNYWKFREKAVGGNQPNFSGKMIGTFEMYLPPLAEQQEIVRILDNILDKEQKAKEMCDVIDKIDHMKKSILARAFRGDLSTNDPTEESALELLKEILLEKV